MNAFRQYFLGLWAVGLLAGVAAAQTAPDAAPPQILGPADVYVPVGDTTSGQDGGVIAGVGLYVMQPFFQNNPAYIVFTQNQVTDFTKPINFDKPNTQTLSEYADRVSVHSHMEVAPLVWLGYVNQDGFGGRARWWTFREGTSQTMTLPPFVGPFAVGQTTAPIHDVVVVTGNQATIASATPLGLEAFGDTIGKQHGAEATALAVTTELYLQVGDLEAIQGFQAGRCNFLVSGGLRLAQINQTYNAYDFQSGIPTMPRSLLSSHNFRGVGPTLALELRRPLGGSGLGVFAIARGSAVFGSETQNASFSGQELRNDDPNPQFATQHQTRAIPVADLEAGFQYGRQVGGSWLFGQVGLVGQEWFGAGSASRSTNAYVLPGFPAIRPVLGGAPLDSNLAFLGLTVRVGLNF